MKNETITIRVDTSLKEDFKKICELEKTDMSDKLYKFINDEIKEKTPVDYENQIELFLKMFGYNNIHIINSPAVEFGRMKCSTIIFSDNYTFTELLQQNKDKEIYIYLLGSKLPNSLRFFLIDK